MLHRRHFVFASWSLADQAIVSFGTFLINIVLARHIPPHEYGIFAILLGTIFLFQTVTNSLVFYPLSVKAGVAALAERSRIVRVAFSLSTISAIPLSAATAVFAFSLTDWKTAVSVAFFYAFRNLQETLRRSLFADFRHRAAIIGDVISYIGPCVILVSLLGSHSISLAMAFATMGAASLAAALVQVFQGAVHWSRVDISRNTAYQFWNLGKWSFSGSMASRLQELIIPVLLAATATPVATASLQAALNITNVSNPIMAGLTNIIPQTTAQASHNGYRAAWRVAFPLIMFGLPLILTIFFILSFFPEAVLGLVYSSEPFYFQAEGAVRVLAFSTVFNYGALAGLSYLLGVGAGYQVHHVEMFGLLLAVVACVALVPTFGLSGSCLALAITNVGRMCHTYVLIALLIIRPIAATSVEQT